MAKDERGKYIVIEGTDGAGTTTQKDLLKGYLADQGVPAIDIAEPGGTPIGDAIRLIIKDGALPRSRESNLDMFTICRRELARQVIAPAIAQGTFVVSDRNWFSTVAYQGFGEGLDVGHITDRTRSELGGFFLPDAALIIDVPVEISETRMQHRGTSANDHFEQMGRPFFEKVRQGYLWSAQEYGLPVVDGTQGIETVHQAILAKLGELAIFE